MEGFLFFLIKLLDEGIGAYPPSEFIPLLHLSSCIRDTSDPSNKIVSWCFLYEDRSSIPNHLRS